MAIREIGTGKDDDDGATENEAWGTLEELLLASAVIRYGPNCWDSIAGELQKRTATNNLYNSQACELKFDDLRRRFAVGAEADEEAVLRTMEDKLKRRRIEALKLELKGRDSSIELKESNLKKLKEAADLVCDSDKRSDSAAAVEEDEAVQASSASGEASDDRAINKPEPEKEETCELENRGITGPGLPEVEPVQTAPKPASPLSLELSDAVAKSKSKEQSHEMQSQETVKRRRNDGEDDGPKPVAAAAAPSKALQPRTLIRILDLIRSQKNCSFFESRLPSQGGKEYKKMIKQHMDLKTVEANMNQGLYVNSESRFFRDILLIFSNFIAFFPKDSPEYVAAQEIQKIVIKEANPTQPPKSAKIQLARVSADDNKEANPLIICRRRSSAYPTEPLEAKSKPKDSHQAAEAAAGINKKDTEKTGKPPLSRKKDVEEKHEGKGNESRSKTSQRTTKNMVRKRNREEESPEDGDQGEDFKTRVKRGKRADSIRVVDKQPQTKVTKEDTTLSRNKEERKYIVQEQNISGDKKRAKVEEKKASKGDNNVGQRKDSEKEASGSGSRVKTAERNSKAVVAKFKERKNKEEEKDKAASNPKYDKNVCVIETDDEEEEVVNKVKRTGKPPPKSDYFRRMKVVMESSSEEEEEEEEDRERDRRNHNELGKVAAAAQRERREEKSNDTRRGGDSSGGSRRRGRPRKSSLPPPTGRDSRRGVKRRPEEEEEEEEEEDLPPSRKRGRR